MIAILERGGHVGVIDGEFLVVEGVENALIVVEDFGSLRDASVLVYDQAVQAVGSLSSWSKFL